MIPWKKASILSPLQNLLDSMIHFLLPLWGTRGQEARPTASQRVSALQTLWRAIARKQPLGGHRGLQNASWWTRPVCPKQLRSDRMGQVYSTKKVNKMGKAKLYETETTASDATPVRFVYDQEADTLYLRGITPSDGRGLRVRRWSCRRRPIRRLRWTGQSCAAFER